MRALLTLLLIGGFIGLVFWDLTSQSQVECNVCIEFNGQTRCALGSGPTQPEAVRSAHTPICQLLANGVTESFACSGTPPSSVTCEGEP